MIGYLIAQRQAEDAEEPILVPFTAACPTCGRDVEWVAERVMYTNDTGSKVDRPEYTIPCCIGGPIR